MKQINNLDDLRYRKLYLRSEIKLKEQKITGQLNDINSELKSADFRNDIIRMAMNNPVLIFNIARITFSLLGKLRKSNQSKNKKNRLSE